MDSEDIDTQDIQQQLDALKQEYAAGLPTKLAALRDTWTEYQSSGSSDPLSELESKLHKLAGSSGVFGYARLGEEAGKLELLIITARADDKHLGENIGVAIQGLDEYLIVDVTPMIDNFDAIEHVVPLSMRPIYVVDDDDELLAALGFSLRQRGYEVKTFNSIKKLDVAVLEKSPGLVVMDMAFPEGRLAGADQIKKLSEDAILRVPTIFVSVHEDMSARLASVRAGSDAYLVKPLDFDEICQQIDVLVSRHWQEAYRVLIVDDEVELAKHYGALLKSAGVDISIVNKPLEIMESLVDFRPDVIILDLHMPQCSGIELADVLRQHEAYRHLPIIFFSTESDLSSQLEARVKGADDFIMKSISPRAFVEVVLNRAQRARSMSTMLGTEPMTGLLNQQSFKEELEAQQKLIARANGLSTLVLIDLDSFKFVNDTYGHLVGDGVIKRFAKFLQSNLRRSDICSRYGGEEFAVIMPATSVSQAAEKIDSIREEFKNTMQSSVAGDFSVTFSAGISTISAEDSDIKLIIDKADKALYAAKFSGRDQVKISS